MGHRWCGNRSGGLCVCPHPCALACVHVHTHVHTGVSAEHTPRKRPQRGTMASRDQG